MALRRRQFEPRIGHLVSRSADSFILTSQNKRNVRRVVTVMVPGITPPTLGIPQPSYLANLPFPLTVPSPLAGEEPAVSLLPVFQTLFSHACPTKAPGEKNRMHSAYQSFLNCPLTGGEKDRREKARKERESKPTRPSLYEAFVTHSDWRKRIDRGSTGENDESISLLALAGTDGRASVP
jgi:RNA exonuclease 1